MWPIKYIIAWVIALVILGVIFYFFDKYVQKCYQRNRWQMIKKKYHY